VGIEKMDHIEAVKQMTAERYLLNELSPDAREEFEDHLFECSECALDLRAGAAFVEEAKAQLPKLTSARPAPLPSKIRVKRDWWLAWLQPAFAAPAFATLLMVLGYQNLVTYPGLRAEANQPRILSSIPLYGATRGGAPVAIPANRRNGLALPVELPPQTSIGTYTSFSFALVDPQGKLIWTGSVAASTDSQADSQRVSLVIPGAMLRNGSYSLTVSGITSQGERAQIDQYAFDLHLTD
jgi:hypothetical protein